MNCLRLYVGCLPYAAQRSEVQQLFIDGHIPVKTIDISIDSFSGRNPGYCFVNLLTEEDADDALQKLNGQELRGRPIKGRMATPKRGSGSNGSSWWPQGDDASHEEPSPLIFDRGTQYDTNEAWTAPVNEGRRLFVGGMPRFPDQATLNEEMRELFKDYDVQAVSKMVSLYWIRKSDPGDHHYCFVDMATVHEADKATAIINGLIMPDGWKWRVFKTTKKPSKLMREQMSGVWPDGEHEEHAKRAESTGSTKLVARERKLEGNWRRTTSLEPERNLAGHWRRTGPVDS